MNLFTSDAQHAEGRPPLSGRTFDQFPAPEGLSPGAKRRRLVTAVLLLAVAIAMAFGFWNLSRRLAPQLTSSPTAPVDENPTLVRQKGIAVLPLENLSDKNDTAFLADGVQGNILSALSKLADLKVVSRTSVNSYPAGDRAHHQRT